MYSLRTGTVKDVEHIRQIIEMTWLHGRLIEAERFEVIRMLDITHSIDKISFEILNYLEHYILAVENGTVVAFASYSVTPLHPPDFKIQKIYAIPPVFEKDYHKILIKHIEGLAHERGSKHLKVHIPENVDKAYFESLGFNLYVKDPGGNRMLSEGFEMIKNL